MSMSPIYDGDRDKWEKQVVPPVPPVPPKLGPMPMSISMSENDAPQPLSAYYTPHEYVDVNGVRNKAVHVTTVVPGAGGKFLGDGQGQPPTGTGPSGWEQRIYGMRRLTFVLAVALVVVVAVAIGLGVGLGVGLKRTGSGGGEFSCSFSHESGIQPFTPFMSI